MPSGAMPSPWAVAASRLPEVFLSMRSMLRIRACLLLALLVAGLMVAVTLLLALPLVTFTLAGLAFALVLQQQADQLGQGVAGRQVKRYCAGSVYGHRRRDDSPYSARRDLSPYLRQRSPPNAAGAAVVREPLDRDGRAG